jgi:hypothetical protein
MPNYQFLIADVDPGPVGAPNPEFGVPFALDPSKATGIPIPAFRSGPITPVMGSVNGEAFLNTTSDQAFVWDGTAWNPIAPAAITTYATDADVLNDLAAPPGTYGTAMDTGNLYIRVKGGISGQPPTQQPDTWRMVGVRTYVDMATLLADITQADGTIAVAMAEQSVWLRAGGNWVPQSPVHYTTEALLMAATPPDGTIGMAKDTGLIYGRMNGAWRRVNSPTITVGSVQPASPALGDLFFDDATGTGMVWQGAQWVSMNAEPIGEIKMWPIWTPPPNFLRCDGSPIPAQYAALIALIGPNTPDLRDQFMRGAKAESELAGTFTVNAGTNNGNVANLTDWNNWTKQHTLGSYVKVTAAFAIPAGNTGTSIDGTALVVNDVIQYVGAAGYHGVAAGPVPPDPYVVPAGGFRKHPYSTALPRNPFVTNNPGDHTHTIYAQAWAAYDSGGAGTTQPQDTSKNANKTSAPAGSHTHTITGGDLETAPAHVRCLFIIRAA